MSYRDPDRRFNGYLPQRSQSQRHYNSYHDRPRYGSENDPYYSPHRRDVPYYQPPYEDRRYIPYREEETPRYSSERHFSSNDFNRSESTTFHPISSASTIRPQKFDKPAEFSRSISIEEIISLIKIQNETQPPLDFFLMPNIPIQDLWD